MASWGGAQYKPLQGHRRRLHVIPQEVCSTNMARDITFDSHKYAGALLRRKESSQWLV